MSRPTHTTSLNRLLTLMVSGILLMALVACNSPSAPIYRAQAKLPQPAAHRVFIEEGARSMVGVPEVILPSFETAAERLNSAKNDAADDYRAANKI